LRERHEEIKALGADVIAIGTGSTAYAAAFVRDEHIPFLVLVDDDAEAANLAAVRVSSFIGLFHPRTWKASRETSRRGFHIHKAGKRVTQMGATFVVGPGARVHYEHIDRDSVDHAPVDDVVAAVRTAVT
jgi:peroxiredoxin